MTLAAQAMTAVQLARERHPADQAVQTAADHVEAALGPVSWADRAGEAQALRGEGAYSACVGYSRADAGVWGRTVGWRVASCDAWTAALQGALGGLARALTAAGDGDAAEVAGAAGEAAGTQLELNMDGIVGTKRDWWESLPAPVKVGAGVLVAWLVLDVLGKVGSARGAFR